MCPESPSPEPEKPAEPEENPQPTEPKAGTPDKKPEPPEQKPSEPKPKIPGRVTVEIGGRPVKKSAVGRFIARLRRRK